MADYVHTIVSIVSEVYCLILLFHFFAEKRNPGNRMVTLGIACVQGILELIITFVLAERLYIRAAAVFVTASVTMYFLFRIHYFTSLILGMFYCGMAFVTEYVTIIVLGGIYPLITGNPLDLSRTFELTITVVISKIMLFVLFLLLGKMVGDKKADVLTAREWWTLFAVSFITIFLLGAMVLEVDLINNTEDQSGFSYITIGMLAINFIVYYLINSIMKREMKLRENTVFRERMKNETAMYRSISENLEKQQKRIHEYKNQITVIGALAAREQYRELKEYIHKLEDAVKCNENVVDTNHVIVNAILNTKYREAVSKNITFVFKVNDLSDLDIREEDIVVLLSNLLNNAIESCEKCTEQNKIIKLKFILEDRQAVISVKNGMETEPVVENGVFMTTKTKEEGEHGLGIRNIVETVERYGGRYAIDHGGGMFLFSILIPQLTPA